MRVHPTGSVTVFTGTHSHGQGHETTFAQLVAEKLGVSIDNVEVVHGDTDRIPFGMGTYGSRSAAVGGSAIVKALDKIVDKGKKIAAHLLEASVADIEFVDGKYRVVGTDRDEGVRRGRVRRLRAAQLPDRDGRAGARGVGVLRSEELHLPGRLPPRRGRGRSGDRRRSRSVDVAIADDVGVIINPMIVDGQAHGGLAQGIGQALLEECRLRRRRPARERLVHGATACRARRTCRASRSATTSRACTHNPIGVKGVGEVGAIGVPPAVINAVLDALAPLGVTDISMPATPEKVWRAIQAARQGGEA